MKIYDIFKKNPNKQLNDEIQVPKNTNKEKSHELETHFNDSIRPFQETFHMYKDQVLEVIKRNLFNDDVKYSDEGIFQKMEIYLKTFFEDKAFEWDLCKNDVFEQIKKYKLSSKIGEILEKNYEYYLVNLVSLNLKGTVNEQYKYIIDYSISENRPLTKQYARMVVAAYHYFKFKHLEDKKDILYSNLIAIIAFEEIKSWIKDDANCIGLIFRRIENRFVKVKVENIDENLLIRRIFASRHFQKLRDEFAFLDYHGMTGKYAHIYEEIIKPGISRFDKKESIVEDSKILETKPDVNAPKKEEAKNLEKNSLIIEQEQVVEKQLSEKIPKKIKHKLEVKEDGYDSFLKKIGNKDVKTNNLSLEYLHGMEKELESIDNNKKNYKFTIYESSKEIDEELENLVYMWTFENQLEVNEDKLPLWAFQQFR